MNYTFIIEEYRGRGKVVTLERGSGAAGARYKVKLVSISGFATEGEAREVYNRLIPQKARSTGDSDKKGVGGYTAPAPPAKRKKTATKTAKKSKGAK